MPNELNVGGGCSQAAVRTNTDHTEIKSQSRRESRQPSRLQDFIRKPFKLNFQYCVGRHQELALYKRLRKMQPKIFRTFRYV